MKRLCQIRYMKELTETNYDRLKQKNPFFNSTTQLFDHTSMVKFLFTCPIEMNVVSKSVNELCVSRNTNKNNKCYINFF